MSDKAFILLLLVLGNRMHSRAGVYRIQYVFSISFFGAMPALFCATFYIAHWCEWYALRRAAQPTQTLENHRFFCWFIQLHGVWRRRFLQWIRRQEVLVFVTWNKSHIKCRRKAFYEIKVNIFHIFFSHPTFIRRWELLRLTNSTGSNGSERYPGLTVNRMVYDDSL